MENGRKIKKDLIDITSDGILWGTVVFVFVSFMDAAIANPLYLLGAWVVGCAWVYAVEWMEDR